MRGRSLFQSSPIGKAALPSKDGGLPLIETAAAQLTAPKPGSPPSAHERSTATKEVNEVQTLRRLFAEFPRREEGQTMAEYGVVLAVITIAVFGALALLSGNIVNAITRVAGYIT